MLELLGRNRSVCSGVSRRELLQAGGAGLFGLSLPKLLQAEEALQKAGAEHAAIKPRAKSVIFVMLFGGPSQLETWDMKPLAPDKIRGPLSPIACRTPGLVMCEMLPKLAAISDKFAILRTLSHDFNDHSGGGHFVQTGKRWHIPIGAGFNATPQDWPSIGSVVEYLALNKASLSGKALAAGSSQMLLEDRPAASALPLTKQNASPNLPSYVVVPNYLGRLQKYTSKLIRPGEYAGWLGRGYDPITTMVNKKDDDDDPYMRTCSDAELTFQIEGLVASEALTLDRLNSRQSLLTQFEQQWRRLDNGNEKVLSAYDRFQRRALSLVASERTRKALDIKQESPELRDRYGRHLFGQSALMARRLVEAGVRYTTVHFDCPNGYGWDSHINNKEVEGYLLPSLDQTLSALLTDLDERGLLDETLVVCLGEMGRTPQLNRSGGRDHWSMLFPALIAGAGIRGGSTVGQTDKDAAYAVTPPHSPQDLAATIYHALGIDHEMRLPDAQGRPVGIMDDGTPIKELFG
ncbi:MAG: DUF1501 domain-containing protein [Planctomycetota bacterium]|nr:DUF1501 domain-containing protein [Planctomycetales bacterium]RLS45901.1 MAG: DUF1501 domain-containing protein [Planctomycetota bacterium]